MPIKYVDGKKVHLPYPKQRKRSSQKQEIKNPPAKYKISNLPRKKLTRDILTQEQIKDDLKHYGGPTVVLTYWSTLKAAKERVAKHERERRDALAHAKEEKLRRKRTRPVKPKKPKKN